MADTHARTDASVLAARLGLAMTRLRSRLRLEQASLTGRHTMSQLAVLRRIAEEGPITASSVAHAEHMRAQSIAEIVATLKKQRLVRARPDPTDGRKSLLTATATGRRIIESIVSFRGVWLSQAIEQHVTLKEREVLASAVEILVRVADCSLESAPAETWRV